MYEGIVYVTPGLSMIAPEALIHPLEATALVDIIPLTSTQT